MTSVGTRVILVRSLEKSARAAFVKQAIQIGRHLIEIKEDLKHGEWQPFAEETFGFSLRTCQEYMKVARYPIHENHYKLGLRCLIDMINTDTDLSYPSIDRYCQGCISYGNGDKCLSIFDNQTGQCPCTNCESRKDCPEMCDKMYAWDDKVNI